VKKNINVKFFFYICLVLLFANTALLSQTWETHTNKDDVQDLCCAGDYCWVATTGGVVKVNIHDFSFETLEREEGLADNITKAVAVDSSNNLWVGSEQSGIAVLDGENSTYYDVYSDNLMYDNVINCFLTDHDNRIWVGTRGGVFVFDGSEKIFYDKKNTTITSNCIYSIKTDNNKNIWFGTANGVSVFDGENWQSFSTVNSALQSNTIYELDFENNNKLWLAAYWAGVYSYENDTWINYSIRNSGLLDHFILTAFVDSKNNKWFGSEYGRVYCYNDTTWCVYDSTNSILPFDSTYTERVRYNPTAQINAITEDKNGNMWFGTKAGLYFYNGTDWKKVTISGTLPSNWVSAIAYRG